MTFLRITILCVSVLVGVIAMMAAVAAKGQLDPGQMACKVVKVPTPANQPPSPYARNLFDGSVLSVLSADRSSELIHGVRPSSRCSLFG
jgi:hypothetical protein